MGLSEEELFVFRMKKSPIYVQLKRIYNEVEAELLYRQYKNTNTLPEKIKPIQNKIKNKPGCVSKASEKFFKELEFQLGRSIKYGSKKEELKLFDEDSVKLYFYDCFDETSNTIIEFNGITYHPNDDYIPEEEREYWTNPWGDCYEYCKNRDKNKISFAEKMGYKVIIVWDKEVSGKNRTNNVVKKLIKVLNENKENKEVSN